MFYFSTDSFFFVFFCAVVVNRDDFSNQESFLTSCWHPVLFIFIPFHMHFSLLSLSPLSFLITPSLFYAEAWNLPLPQISSTILASCQVICFLSLLHLCQNACLAKIMFLTLSLIRLYILSEWALRFCWTPSYAVHVITCPCWGSVVSVGTVCGVMHFVNCT